MKQEIYKKMSFLMNRVPILIILNLGNCKEVDYSNKLCKMIDVTQSNLYKTINMLEQIYLLVMEKKGRIKNITLTKKGKMLKAELTKLDSLL